MAAFHNVESTLLSQPVGIVVWPRHLSGRTEVDLSHPYSWLRTVHIGAAFLGLVVFWLPLLVRKGSRMHVVCGRAFVVCAAVTLATVFAICGCRFIDPIGLFSPEVQPPTEQAADFVRWVQLIYAFLGALAFYTFVTLVLAVRVVRARHAPGRLAGVGGRLLLWSQVGVSFALMGLAAACWMAKPTEILCAVAIGTGLAGVGSAWLDLRFLASPRTSPMSWWYKHMEFMLRTGIAFHTAFAVFVLTPWLGRLGNGPWALVPWLLPTAVGLPVVWLWIRHYRRRFGELAPAALAATECRLAPGSMPNQPVP